MKRIAKIVLWVIYKATEKASLLLLLEAMKHQAERSVKENCSQVGINLVKKLLDWRNRRRVG